MYMVLCTSYVICHIIMRKCHLIKYAIISADGFSTEHMSYRHEATDKVMGHLVILDLV